MCFSNRIPRVLGFPTFLTDCPQRRFHPSRGVDSMYFLGTFHAAKVWIRPCRCPWTFIRFGHRRCVNTRRRWGRSPFFVTLKWSNSVEFWEGWGGFLVVGRFQKKPTIVVGYVCGKMRGKIKVSRKWLAWLDFFHITASLLFLLIFWKQQEVRRVIPTMWGCHQNSTKWWAPTIVVNMEWHKPPKKLPKLSLGFLDVISPLKKDGVLSPYLPKLFFLGGPPWTGLKTLRTRKKVTTPEGTILEVLRAQKPHVRKMERDDFKHHLFNIIMWGEYLLIYGVILGFWYGKTASQ